MDVTRAWYKRYWEPNFVQTISLSIIAGGIATSITHPIQYIKTVIQYRSEGVGLQGDRYKVWQQGYNPFKILRDMHGRGGGFLQFYGGFEANLIGRLSYLAIRNTLYKVTYDQMKPQKATNDLTNLQKSYIGAFSGGIAAFLTTPFTLVSIRQILDSQIKPEWRRGYRKVGNAISSLGHAKFTGSFENVIRHILLNVTLIAPYDYFHESLYIKFGDYIFVEPVAMALATGFSAFIVLPFDTARTRVMQYQSQPERNRMQNNTMMKVFFNSLKHERTNFALLAGYWTYFAQTYLYAYLTVGVTNSLCNQMKGSKGLKENQI